MTRNIIPGLVLVAMLATGVAIRAAENDPHQHAPANHMMRAQDPRELVHFPEPLLEHELANMRDHLLTLSRIQEYLSQHEFEKAADLAEKRLGMSSFGLHGAHEVAPYMPKGMQEAGTAMHHAASRFAITAQNAAINDDVGRALGALNEVTQACISCHAAYRLR